MAERKDNRSRKAALAWLAAAVWMAVIFFLSAQDAERSGNTSGNIVRWVVGLLYWDLETLSVGEQMRILETWSVIIRKGAHFTEYAVLSGLVANGLGCSGLKNAKRWLFSVAVCMVYAVTDELHQYFVPGRACRLLDVGIDTCGAAFGAALFAAMEKLYLKYRKKKEKKKP